MSNIVEIILKGNDQSAKAIASSVRNLQGMESSLGAIRSQLAGILSVGALASLAKSAIDMASNLEDASKKFGVSAAELSQLQYVAKLSGVEFEDLGGAFKFLAKSISAAEDPSSEAALAFKAMGFSVRELKTLSPNEVFLRLADAFAGMSDGANKTALALAIFGRAGANILPVLADGALGIAKLKNEAVAIGATLSGEQIATLDAYGDAIDKIGLVAKSTAGRLMIDMGDALKWLFRQNDIALNLVDKLNAAVAGTSSVKTGKIADILTDNPEPGPKKDAKSLAAMKQDQEDRLKAQAEYHKQFLKLTEDFASRATDPLAVLFDVEKNAAQMKALETKYAEHTNLFLAMTEDFASKAIDPLSVLFQTDKADQAREDALASYREGLDQIVSMTADFNDEFSGMETTLPTATLFDNAVQAGNVEGAIAIWEQGFGAHTMFLEEAAAKVQAYQDIWTAANQSFSAVAVSIGMAARDQLIGTLTNVVMGAQKASEAFKALGKAIISMIVEAAMKWIVNRLIMAAIGKSIQAAETAASIAMAGTVAAAWAPAAAFTSLASFGANAAPAMAGLAGSVALATALSVPKLAEGGIVPATHGGRLVRVAEGGQDEAIIPLDRGARSPTRIELHLDGSVLAAWMTDAQRSGVLQLRMA